MEPAGTRRFSIRQETDPTAWLEADPSSHPLQAREIELHFDPEDGSLWIETIYQSEVARPAEIWYGRVLCWEIPITTNAVTLSTALNAGEFDDLLSLIVAGYSVRWNGNSHVGELTETAEDASSEMQERLDGYSETLGTGAGFWDASDWFDPLGYDPAQWEREGLTATTTDAELEAIAERFEAEAKAEGGVLGGTENHLREVRDELRAQLENEDEVS